MRLSTRIRSSIMRLLASDFVLQRRRTKGRKKREAQGLDPVIYYFHQVDDPYSFIMAQQLTRFAEISSVQIKPFLVSDPAPVFKGDAKRFDDWTIADAASIAPFFGQALPMPSGAESPMRPSDAAREAAEAALSPILDAKISTFTAEAHRIGLALWQQDPLPAPGPQQKAQAKTCVAAADKLRKSLGHFQGGTLYFDGEWYWGVDRLPLLLARLKEEGHSRASVDDFDIYEAGGVDPLTINAAVSADIMLEYFPSLRSPYTAVGHASVEAMVERSKVELHLRPVMPMLMRGVTAPRQKQQFIMADSVREARAKNVAFGNFVDPFGEPVRRGFALFPGAQAQGKGLAFIGAYLSAAFAEGIDIDSKRGLQQVVTNAGLDWQTTVDHPDNTNWKSLLDTNVNAMLGAGLWGVPSFRVSSPGEPDFCCWGQDRIWRVEHELARRSAQP
ncbi:MAG: DsbA family protein [Pseudomonadota bacterium]|nr:DsbA family protein [Pseudomonadota bacterium]